MLPFGKRRAGVTIVLFALALCGGASDANGQDQRDGGAEGNDAREQSRVAFASGARALEEGRAKEALALFQRAYELFPHYSTLYNIGLCERALGRPVEAAAAFLRYLDEGGEALPASEIETAAKLLKEAEQKIARVTLSTSPSDATVTLDGAAAAQDEALRVNPGDHVAEATAKGRARVRKTFEAPSGGEMSVRLELPALPSPVRGPRLDALFWTTAGVSAGALVAGAVTGGIALSDSSAYSDPATPDAEAEDRRARGEALRVVADVCFGAAILGGISAVLLATLRSPAPAATVALSPRSVGLRATF